MLRRWITEVRTDLVANIVQPGRFVTIERGLTFHIRARLPNGQLSDVLLDYQRNEFLLRTPFLYTETRGDESQRYAATAWHTLARLDGRLRIRLKRIDLLNCDAALPSIQLFL